MTELRYFSEKLPINCIEEPSGYISGMARENVPYQMKASVRILEEEHFEQDRAHVLQLNVPNGEAMGAIWELYVDGVRVASGDMEYAAKCFAKSATAFKDVCQAAVEDCKVSPCTQREYVLLCKARRIAALS